MSLIWDPPEVAGENARSAAAFGGILAVTIEPAVAEIGALRLPPCAAPRTSLTECKGVPVLGAHTAKIRGEFPPGAPFSDFLSRSNSPASTDSPSTTPSG